jgi:hypothetical protein
VTVTRLNSYVVGGDMGMVELEPVGDLYAQLLKGKISKSAIFLWF